MKNFDKADDVISTVKNDDFWEESEVDYVRILVEKFSLSDWDALEKVISSKSDKWKARCAQALSASLTERSFKILLSLLNSTDDLIVVRVIESLGDFENKFDISSYAGSDVYAIAKATIQSSKDSEAGKTVTISLLDSLFKK